MNTALMILLALAIGWFVRDRLIAFVAYLAAFSLVFTFQSIVLIMDWADGSTRAFGSFPNGGKGQVWSYGLVNLGFLIVGFGLLTGTSVLAARRRAVASGPVATRVAA